MRAAVAVLSAARVCGVHSGRRQPRVRSITLLAQPQPQPPGATRAESGAAKNETPRLGRHLPAAKAAGARWTRPPRRHIASSGGQTEEHAREGEPLLGDESKVAAAPTALKPPDDPDRQPEEMLLAHLAAHEGAEDFSFASWSGDDDDEAGEGRLGVDAALAAWDGVMMGPASLAGIIARASGLDSGGDGVKAKGKRGGGAFSPGATGRAAAMCNVVLSALDIRGGAHEDALSLLFEHMPAIGVDPDVVSYSLAAAAAMHAGDDAAATDVLAHARRAVGADKRSNAKRKKKGRGKGRGPEEEENLRVLWEDEHVAAVFKPAGVLVHPVGGGGGGNKHRATLVDMLAERYGEEGLSAINGVSARGIVHRLDRPTSGVMLVARSDRAHALLVAAWYQRRVRKKYLALVEGLPGRRRESGAGALSGVVVADVDRRPARSSWRVMETFEGNGGSNTECSLVEVMPHTGRKHQVRQHMGLALDAPLIGDTLYRKGKPARTPPEAAPLLTANGAKPGSVFFLHAAGLTLDHPVTGTRLELSEPLPPTFERLLVALRRSG